MRTTANFLKYNTHKYNLAVRFFHWVGALMIVAAVAAVNLGDDYVDLHKSIGASFLMWTILRVAVRFVSKIPPYPPMPKWQIGMAHLTHLGLYLAMLAMPITGALMSMYGGRAVSVFGLFNMPSMVGINRDMAKLMNELHTEAVFYVLVFLIVAHVSAALYHQFVMKDNLIDRIK